MTTSSGPQRGRVHVPVQQLAQEVRHAVEVARDARRLREVVALRVEHRGGVVQQLAHDGAAAGAPDRHVHLGGRGGQRVADDLDLDGSERHGVGSYASRAAMSAPAGAEARRPAGGDEVGGEGLLDDRRPVDAVLRRERVAVPDRQVAPVARPRRRGARPLRGPRARGGRRRGASSGFGRQADRLDAQGDDLDRAARLGIAEPLLGASRGSARAARRARPRRRAGLVPGHQQLEGLAVVAHVGRDLDSARRASATPSSASRASASRRSSPSSAAISGRLAARGRQHARPRDSPARCRRTGCHRRRACRARAGRPPRGCPSRPRPPSRAARRRRRRTAARSRAGRAPSRTATAAPRRRGWRWSRSACPAPPARRSGRAASPTRAATAAPRRFGMSSRIAPPRK